MVGSDSKVTSAVGKVLPAWNIAHADNNKAALEMLKSRPFELVLTGEGTSGKQDVELLRQIRIVRPHVRLIIITSESTPADVIAAMRERASAISRNPIRSRHLNRCCCWRRPVPFGMKDRGSIRDATIHPAHCALRPEDGRSTDSIHSRDSGSADKERDAVGMAFREMLMNAIEHGAHFKSTQHVDDFLYPREAHGVMPGERSREGFSLEEARHAAITNPPSDPSGTSPSAKNWASDQGASASW